MNRIVVVHHHWLMRDCTRSSKSQPRSEDPPIKRWPYHATIQHTIRFPALWRVQFNDYKKYFAVCVLSTNFERGYRTNYKVFYYTCIYIYIYIYIYISRYGTRKNLRRPQRGFLVHVIQVLTVSMNKTVIFANFINVPSINFIYIV